jgi:pimeloyl-ACP methyl ester carboxylesterase
MRSAVLEGQAAEVPLRGELRYGLELARLSADRAFLLPPRSKNAPPVLLIPGFMAGDPSLSVLRSWLWRRGSRTWVSGMRLNVDCGERSLRRIELRLSHLAAHAGRPVTVIGQSRGGGLARGLAVRNPELVGALVMLGSPVCAPLNIGPTVLGAVRSVARLGDFGVPGVFSSRCAQGECCRDYRRDLAAPLPREVRGFALYSRSDGIVSWQACLDPSCEQLEVDSSHTGMSVNLDVYRALARILDQEAQRWTS